MSIKVSVIITTFNSAKTVMNALESVISQVDITTEILIIDDHSADFELVKEMVSTVEGTTINLIRPEDKGNANVSRNIGIKAAKGELIAFLDSDDTWNPRHLIEAVNKLDQSSADVCFSKVQFLQGCDIKPALEVLYNNDIEDFIFSNGVSVTSSLVVRKNTLNKCCFDEKQKKHQDWEFLIRAQENGFVIVQSNYVGLNYTLSTGSNMSSNFNPAATVRFLNCTLSQCYHAPMLYTQLNAMISKGNVSSIQYLYDEIQENYRLGFVTLPWLLRVKIKAFSSSITKNKLLMFALLQFPSKILNRL